MLGELVPCGGGDTIPLLKPKLLIGRRSKCDIALDFPNISSQHCTLELHNGYWQVRDLGSRNGVKVNGERVDSKWLLPHDVVSIAKHRFEIVYTPQSDAPPPEEENPFAVSLMEKAGLARRRAEDVPTPPQGTPAVRSQSTPNQPAPKKAPPSGPRNDDDLALDFLNE